MRYSDDNVGKARSRRVDQLFDLLADAPLPMTAVQMKDALGCERRMLQQAVHDLRIMLGDDDSINLVATRNGRGPWLYELTGNVDVARPWRADQYLHLTTRARTSQAIVASLQRATDGRTLEGRSARLWNRTLTYVIATLDDLEDSGA